MSKTYKIVHWDLGILWMTFANELVKIKKQIPNDVNDEFKRSYIRTLFSLIEAVTFQIRQVLLERSYNKEIELSFHEVYILKEKTYDINDRGKIREKEQFYPFKNLFKYTFKIYSKIYNKTDECDKLFAKDGFKKLMKIHEMRNSLSHPKKVNELKIENIEIVYDGYLWFQKLCFNLLNKDLLNENKNYRA